jgi:hypothetical protein
VRAVAEIIVRSRLRRLAELVELREIVEALDATREIGARLAAAPAFKPSERRSVLTAWPCGAFGSSAACAVPWEIAGPALAWRIASGVIDTTPCFARSLT